MFGLGFQEIVVIAILALVLLGPKKLPELAHTLGKFIRDFQRATDDLKREINDTLEDARKSADVRPPQALDARPGEDERGGIAAESPEARPKGDDGPPSGGGAGTPRDPGSSPHAG